MMDKSQIIAEVKKRLPGYSPKEIEQGIMEFAQANPKAEPEQALQALDIFIAQNGVPKQKKNLSTFLGEV